MQAAAPELLDLSDESQATLDSYGVNRPEPKGIKGGRGAGSDVHAAFARNCLLARRLAERGVRFIQLYHRAWDHHGGIKRAMEITEIGRASCRERV